jgi:hypothetical protein
LAEKYHDVNGDHDGWSEESHQLYLKIRDEYAGKSSVTGGMLLERLRMELPHHSAKAFTVSLADERITLWHATDLMPVAT